MKKIELFSKLSRREAARRRWQENRDRAQNVLQKRKERYAKDPSYRKLLKESVRRQRSKKSSRDNRRSFNRDKIVVVAGVNVVLWGTGKTAAAIGIANRTLLDWVRRSVIPHNWLTDELGRYWFPVTYVEFLAEQLESKSGRLDVWSHRVEEAWRQQQAGPSPLPVVSERDSKDDRHRSEARGNRPVNS